VLFAAPEVRLKFQSSCKANHVIGFLLLDYRPRVELGAMRSKESPPKNNVSEAVRPKNKRFRRGNIRTVVLALTAALTFVWASINVWDVSADEMLSFFLMSVLLVLVLVVLAAGLVVFKRLLKKLFER
jgi:K+-sensing histidine kinase KdpD